MKLLDERSSEKMFALLFSVLRLFTIMTLISIVVFWTFSETRTAIVLTMFLAALVLPLMALASFVHDNFLESRAIGWRNTATLGAQAQILEAGEEIQSSLEKAVAWADQACMDAEETFRGPAKLRAERVDPFIGNLMALVIYATLVLLCAALGLWLRPYGTTAAAWIDNLL